MVSLLSMVIKAVSGFFINILKALFSLLSWFAKGCVKVTKLFFVVLPVTSAIFVALFIVNIFMLLSWPESASTLDSVSEGFAQGDLLQMVKDTVRTGTAGSSSMFLRLRTWWNDSVYSTRGTASYVILLPLTILMFVPVMVVLFVISVFRAYGAVLFIAFLADMFIYIARASFGKDFVSQAMGRYYLVVPDAGRKHEERLYEKNLRRKNREFEEEDRGSRRSRADSFYEDSDDIYDDYDPEYDEEYEDEYYEEEEYGDEYYEEEEYEDEDYEEEEYGDEDFEDDYDAPPYNTVRSSFDFFAGCNSPESAERKYKTLVKLYHPDNMDGDTQALQEINVQYAEFKKRSGC